MATDESLTVYLTVTAQQGQRVPLTLPKDSTPTDLRKNASIATNIPLSSLRLIFRGRMIKDDESSKVVPEYKLESDCVLHCLGKPAESNSASSNPPVPATTTAGASVSVSAGVQPVAQAPAAGDDPLKIGLNTLRASNPPATYLTAVSTLEKILNNITANPMEEKYRKVKRQNAAFQRRLGGLPGGDAAMKGAGFVVETQEGEEVYMMHANADAWPKLVAAKAAIDAALQAAKSNEAIAPVNPPAAAASPFAGTMPGALPSNFGSMPGGMNPSMNAAMAQMMSDPNALQTMLQNPMVQQMIQNDPNVPPMLRDSINQLASNPAMVNQLSQMMRDPNMRSQIERMVGNNANGMGGAGMGGAFGASMGNVAPNGQQPTGAGSSTGRSDQAQTEEEMIAEAIRRSLEEG